MIPTAFLLVKELTNHGLPALLPRRPCHSPCLRNSASRFRTLGRQRGEKWVGLILCSSNEILSTTTDSFNYALRFQNLFFTLSAGHNFFLICYFYWDWSMRQSWLYLRLNCFKLSLAQWSNILQFQLQCCFLNFSCRPKKLKSFLFSWLTKGQKDVLNSSSFLIAVMWDHFWSINLPWNQMTVN